VKRAALMLALAGCAHVPRELVEAREDFAAAREDADLSAARAALDLATYEYEEHGDSPKARDFAYIAQRRVDIANSKARKHADERRLAAAKAELAQRNRLRAEIEEQAARLPRPR